MRFISQKVLPFKSTQRRITLFAIGVALMVSAFVSPARAQQGSLTKNQTRIVDTVSAMFAALRSDDATKFNAVVAPDFYIFDGGKRINGESIMALIKAQHAAGKHFEWNVTEPDVHISGSVAWIAYVNRGSIADQSGKADQEWLESAFLQRKAGDWKIVFMHSTRVPAPQETRK